MLTSMLLAEYEQLSKDLEMRKERPFAVAAYLQSIIVNLGKIFSSSQRNEPFRLKRFTELGYPSVTAKVESIEEKYKVLIEKVRNNRDKIFVHTGHDYHKMLFSREHVSQLEKSYGTKYPQLLAQSSGNERYTAVDLTNDIPKIRDVLDELNSVWQEALASDPQFKID
jgi:hypothetical protein